MNVSCRGVLMKEVASEKEAMDEIRQYLEVNGLELKWVSIDHGVYRDRTTNNIIDEHKSVKVGISVNTYERFVIRYNSDPPHNSIDELYGRMYVDKKEFRSTWYVMSTLRMAVWADEFRNYIQDLNRRLGGV